MPQNEEMKMDYVSMLEDLADEYPEIKEKALDLSSDISDLMPGDEEMPLEGDDSLEDISLEEMPEDELSL
jgi:hypothetical protein